MTIARKPAKISNYKFICAMLYIIENGCKWRALPKKYGHWHTIYMRCSRWSKNGTIAKIVESMKKQKLLNEEDYIFFIDSTSIKVSPDANKNKNNQKEGIGRSKGGLQRSCTYVVHLHVRWPFTCLLTTFTTSMKEANCLNPYISKIILIFWRTEFTKIIKLWLWLRIVGLRPLFHLKKNRKLPWNYYKHLHKQRNNIERYFLRLRRFRKVFTRYDKLDSIFISTISLAFIFDLLFM